MHRPLIISVLSFLLLARPAVAIIPVIDWSNVVQNTISAIADVETAVQAALEVANSYTQIANQYTQITHQATQIANQVKNLTPSQVIPVTQQVLGMSSSIATTLAQAQGVSHHLSQATAQFDALYPHLQGVLTSTDILAKRRQWLAHRRNAAAVGMQVQAITQHLQTMATQMSQLLQQAAATQGNLDIQQVRAQQEGLTQAALLQMQQILAGNGRLEAQRGAEEATMYDAALNALEAASTPDAPYTGAQGRLIHYRW